MKIFHQIITVTTMVALSTSFYAVPASAQATAENADTSAILQTMDRFFDALAAADRAGLEATTIAGSRFVSASVGNDGEEVINTNTREQFVNALSNPQTKRLERYWEPIVLVRENIAAFWAPYDFHIDGEFSHCGIDSFQLFKIAGQWLIGSSSYNRETENCPNSPLGPID